MNIPEIKNFLEISYEQLEELNLNAKRKAEESSAEDLRGYYLDYLKNEKQLKAVTVGFSDLEGRFHMLDYDKRFLLEMHRQLTFDGSSIRGFSVTKESDLLLDIDWSSFRWVPADVFGPGKVFVFGLITERNGSPYSLDSRSILKLALDEMRREGMQPFVSVEIEGFLFQGQNAEQQYLQQTGFNFASTGGYFHALPRAPLKVFIDSFADAQRAMGFENEKDHPEIAPAQFELNYRYCDPLRAADQVQLYKLLARQIAQNMGFTASFLPQPVAGVHGSGMHTHISIHTKKGNMFYGAKTKDNLSEFARGFVDRLLHNANDISLVLSSSVNSYRRLSSEAEAPNQIRASCTERGTMIRIPLLGPDTARIQVRCISPDANPYMAFLCLLHTGLHGPEAELQEDAKRTRTRFLPSNIYDALRHFKSSTFAKEMLGEAVHARYADIKQQSADRCPKELGTIVKTGEIRFHHEVTNQYLWNQF